MVKMSRNPQPYAVERKNKQQGTEKKSNLAGSESERSKKKKPPYLNGDSMSRKSLASDEYRKIEKVTDSYDEENDGF